MSTEIANFDDQGGEVQTYQVEQRYGDELFNDMAKGQQFLPRLQLFGTSSEPVKKGDLPPASYALVLRKDKYHPLGKSVDLIAFCWRPKALDTSVSPPVAVFDHNNQRFVDIQERSGEQDSGCLYGPEFLVWVPSANRFATLLFGSKSARMEAPNLKGRIGKPVTLTTDLVTNKRRQSWHVIVVNACSAPFEVPTPSDVQSVAKEFNNPPAEKVEEDTPPEAEAAMSRDR